MAREKEATGQTIVEWCVAEGLVEQMMCRTAKKSSLNGQTKRVQGLLILTAATFSF